MHPFRPLSLAIAVALVPMVACKKQAQPEAAPAEPKPEPELTAEPEPAPEPLAWTWGTARHLPGEDDGVGSLSMSLSVANQTTDKALQVHRISLGVRDPSGARVCVVDSTEIHAAAPGETADIVVSGPCAATKLPEGDTVPLLGTIDFALGGAGETLSVGETVGLER